MSFSWAEFLTLADGLFRNPTVTIEEACFRSATSRAYYAAYGSARNYGRDKEGLWLSGGARDHQLVRDHFMNTADPTRKKIGLDLDRLRDDRNAADYNDALVSPAKHLAQLSLATAWNVLNALSSLP